MKKFARFLLILISIPAGVAILVAISGASMHNSELAEENSQLKEKIRELNQTVEGLRNEPQALFSRAHDQRRSNKFPAARLTLDELRSKYPEFRIEEVRAALEEMESAEKAHIAEVAEKEVLRLQDQERVAAENARMAEQKRVEAARLASEREKELAKIVKTLKKTTDEIKEVDYFRDSSTPVSNNAKNIHAYIGKSKEQVWMRFKMCYSAEDWLFVESVSFKVDGTTTTLNNKLFENWERDNAGGGIWEWKDVPMDPETLALVKSIANSKSTIMRYEGRQYHSDREISATEKKALKNIITAFEAMGVQAVTANIKKS